MRNVFFYFVLLTISFTACKTTKVNDGNKSEQSVDLQINLKEKYVVGETIKIEITNVSGDELVLLNPTKTNIQKKVGDNWKSVRIIYCPCDAPCREPIGEMNLPNGKVVNLNWNQKEGHCGKITDAGIRETIYENVEKGAYRLVVAYKNNNKTNEITKEFKIK